MLCTSVKQSQIPHRNHHTSNPIQILHEVGQKIHTWKPRGLWYSFNWYWLENLEKGYEYHSIEYEPNPEKVYTDVGYLYPINLRDDQFTTLDSSDPNKVLQLFTRDEYRRFAERFTLEHIEAIDWIDVATLWAGIELPRFEWRIQKKLSPGWDGQMAH